MPDCSMAVQRLYDACKATFTHNIRGPFSAQGVLKVRSLLDSIKPADVGLDDISTLPHVSNTEFLERINGKKNKVSPPISYLHIYECEDFSMGIFCLPASAVIPLHNHPGMTVLSKLLYGKMHVKAYDWVDHSEVCNPKLAKVTVNGVMNAPCESAVLYPTCGGNIHAFTAVTSCAVLDVLAPPYSSEDGRHCTYYRIIHHVNHEGSGSQDSESDQSEADMAWLEEFHPPKDFVVKTGVYKGPKISP